MNSIDQHVELLGGEIRLWVEQGQLVCLLAATREGDAVEMSGEEAARSSRNCSGCGIN